MGDGKPQDRSGEARSLGPPSRNPDGGRQPLLQQFRPSFRARSVTEITVEFLAERGIRALVLDLDNTLVPWHGREADPGVLEWIAGLRQAGIEMCIVSNTHRPLRLKDVAARLGIRCVPSGGKPRRRGFRRALEAMGAAPEETVVVGDQLMTDVWGGNRSGLRTILVEPLSRIEFWGTRLISRRIERLLLLHAERRSGPISRVGGGEE